MVLAELEDMSVPLAEKACPAVAIRACGKLGNEPAPLENRTSFSETADI
jgi:hypothetical protein